MYNCVIDIALIGCGFDKDAVFKGLELPEDCEIKLSGHKSESPDSIIIYGSYQHLLENYSEKSFRAVITDGVNIPAEIVGKADLWCIPENSPAEITLLRSYISALIGRVKENFDSRRYKICLETATDSVPDLIWFKDLRGAHLIVNDSFCKAVEKTKEQIYKRGHFYIWDIPKEEYEQGEYICLESEAVVINAGKTCLFDEKVKTKSGMRQFKTYKSPMYDVNGELFGTCGVALDVTDLHNISNELTVVLESVPFGIMIEDNDETLISFNSTLAEYFPDIKGYEKRNCAAWKNHVIGEAEKANMNEFAVKKNGVPRIIKFAKEPVHDVFGEIIGRVIIFQDVTAERLFQKRTMEHANTDFLTKLNNRRSLFAHLDKIKNSPQLSMITVDLDNFKKINDTLGHAVGDEILVGTAEILNECFSKDFVARLGGDEFLIVINRRTDREILEKETQVLIDAFRKKFSGNPDYSVMTMSAGIATALVPDGYQHNPESLMYSSDCALYKAKKGGKSRFVFYEE